MEGCVLNNVLGDRVDIKMERLDWLMNEEDRGCRFGMTILFGKK